MNTTHHKPTGKQKTKPAPQIQLLNTLDEADYYDTAANLAKEKADYFHLQYS